MRQTSPRHSHSSSRRESREKDSSLSRQNVSSEDRRTGVPQKDSPLTSHRTWQSPTNSPHKSSTITSQDDSHPTPSSALLSSEINTINSIPLLKQIESATGPQNDTPTALSLQFSLLQKAIDSNNSSVTLLKSETKDKLASLQSALETMGSAMEKLEKRTVEQEEFARTSEQKQCDDSSTSSTLPEEEDRIVDHISDAVIEKLERQLEPLLGHHLGKLQANTESKLASFQSLLKKETQDEIARGFTPVSQRMDHVERLITTTIESQQNAVEANYLQEVKSQLKEDVTSILEDINNQYHLSQRLLEKKLDECTNQLKSNRELEDALSQIVVERMEQAENRLRNSLQSLMATKHFRHSLLRDFAQEVKSSLAPATDSSAIKELGDRLSRVESLLNTQNSQSSQDTHTDDQIHELTNQVSRLRQKVNNSSDETLTLLQSVVPQLVDSQIEKFHLDSTAAQLSSFTAKQSQLSARMIREVVQEEIIALDQPSVEMQVQSLLQEEMRVLRKQHQDFIQDTMTSSLSVLRILDSNDKDNDVAHDNRKVENNDQQEEKEEEDFPADILLDSRTVDSSVVEPGAGNDSFLMQSPIAGVGGGKSVSPTRDMDISHTEQDEEDTPNSIQENLELMDARQDTSSNNSSSSQNDEKKEMGDLHTVSRDSLSDSETQSSHNESQMMSEANNSEEISCNSSLSSQQEEIMEHSFDKTLNTHNTSFSSTVSAYSSPTTWCIHIPLVILFSVIFMVIYDLFFPLKIQFEGKQFHPS